MVRDDRPGRTTRILVVLAAFGCVFAGVTTFVTMPWQHGGSYVAFFATVQIFGALGIIAVGAGLLFLARR
jgi:hypothetical protein